MKAFSIAKRPNQVHINDMIKKAKLVEKKQEYLLVYNKEPKTIKV